MWPLSPPISRRLLSANLKLCPHWIVTPPFPAPHRPWSLLTKSFNSQVQLPSFSSCGSFPICSTGHHWPTVAFLKALSFFFVFVLWLLYSFQLLLCSPRRGNLFFFPLPSWLDTWKISAMILSLPLSWSLFSKTSLCVCVCKFNYHVYLDNSEIFVSDPVLSL